MFSPKRLSASLDDMRRKAIAKRISRDLRATVLDPNHSPQDDMMSMTNTTANSTIRGKLTPIHITGTPGFHTGPPGFHPGTPGFHPGTPGFKSGTPGFKSGTPSTTIQHFREEYILIPEQDMSFATDKQCKELDIYNESLYKKSYKLYREITAKLAGSNLELKQAPQPPPNPNNLHRLVQYRQRNRETNCLKQTAAVCYLLSLGYQLSAYNPYEPLTTTDSTNKLVEPYQAIELAANLAASRHENYLDAAQHLFGLLGITDSQPCEMATAPPLTRPPSFNQDYYSPSPSHTQRPVSAATDSVSFPNYPSSYQSNLYPQLEPDVMLGTSSTGLLLVAQSGATAFSLNSHPPGVGLEFNVNGPINNSSDTPKLPSYPMPDRRATAPAKLLPVGLDTQTRGIDCQNPEHNSVPEKIKYFDDTANTNL